MLVNIDRYPLSHLGFRGLGQDATSGETPGKLQARFSDHLAPVDPQPHQ